MLIRMLPDQIAKWWIIEGEHGIKQMVEAALPPIAGDGDDRMNSILAMLLAGAMDCWAIMNEDQVIRGMLTTTFTFDSCTNTKNLLLYTLYTVEETGPEDWKEGFDRISKWAAGHDCQNVVCYTQNEAIVNNALAVGGQIWSYIAFPLST